MDDDCATDYVTKAAWLANPSRPDAIDDIADQFERRQRGDEAFWTAVLAERAARVTRIAPRHLHRRVG